LVLYNHERALLRQSSDELSPSLTLLFLSSLLALPATSLSDIGQDAVDEQGHDGGAEQAGHRHRDEPGQEDVPKEVPIHGFLGSDPAHGYDRAHLETANGEKEERQSAAELNLFKAAESAKSCRVSLPSSGLRLAVWSDCFYLFQT
ncbi:hypothetical protein XENOCAPTIV_011674, partial [Xenoophorus captivus]